MILFAAITPHPPIIIPTIGQIEDINRAKKTINAMVKLGKDFCRIKPQIVIVISPHGIMNYNKITINTSPVLVGHFYAFSDLETELIVRNDENLGETIVKECKKLKIPLEDRASPDLDHGILVPLHYLFEDLDPQATRIRHFKDGRLIRVIPITPSFAGPEVHFQFGKVLQKIAMALKTKIAIIASGDLSHRLTVGAPAGYSRRGAEFDNKIVDLLKKRDAKAILNLDPGLVEEAGECGFRPIATLLGALDGLNWTPEILSYEGPFGVGYLAANIKLA